MTQVERYVMMTAAREALIRAIREDAADPTVPAKLHDNPEKVMRAYGELAKLDKEISQMEEGFHSDWRKGF